MRRRLFVFVGAVFAVCLLVAVQAAAPLSRQNGWSVTGGEVGLRWNHDFAADLGLRVGVAEKALPGRSRSHHERFAVAPGGGLEPIFDGIRFRGFSAGSLQAQGGYVVATPDGVIDLTDFRLRVREGHPFQLDLVSRDGRAWFFADRLMYDKTKEGGLTVRTADVRISDELAQRLHEPEAAGWSIADAELNPEILRRGADVSAPAGSCNDQNGANCNFAGGAAPDGGTYQADLFMETFSDQYSRCDGCSGNAGSGRIVFSPTSMLKNNVNAGTLEPTIGGDPLGTSAAPWAADIPWYEMFSGNFPPYGNDQHPFLIWNLYRTNADGSLEQIARSGVKHAFLTVNGGDECPYSYGHVLGRTCDDTYGVSNNDDESRLGPRSEIIPATNQWGRCGSVFDPACTQQFHDPDNGGYGNRLIVNEAQISPTVNAGAHFMFESWYLAREDIDIYNSMGTQQAAPVYTGSVWNPHDSGYALGPAIDRWVDPAAPPANSANHELAVDEGHAKLAVRVTANGDGTWRYDYAVMNFDFARAVTEGAEPNLRVLSNHGFDSFRIPLPAGVAASATRFSDGDLDAGNDWTVTSNGGYVTFSAPAGTNSLDWGALYAFSITVDAAPAAGPARLHVLQSGAPQAFDVDTLVPSGAELPIFADGFDPPADR